MAEEDSEAGEVVALEAEEEDEAVEVSVEVAAADSEVVPEEDTAVETSTLEAVGTEEAPADTEQRVDLTTRVLLMVRDSFFKLQYWRKTIYLMGLKCKKEIMQIFIKKKPSHLGNFHLLMT